MIYELEIVNYPQEKASKEFKDFIDAKFSVSSSKIVHVQTENNKKILIYRLMDEQKFKEVNGSKAEFLEKEFEFKEYERPQIKKINNILSQRKKERELGIPYSNQNDISKVYLSNIPNNLTDKQLKDRMTEFGEVAGAQIIDKDRETGKKLSKFKFAVVKFTEFESAVKAYFQDKVEFGKKRAKIKLFMPEKASKFFKKRTPANVDSQMIPNKRVSTGNNSDRIKGNTTSNSGPIMLINYNLTGSSCYRPIIRKISRLERDKFASDDLPKFRVRQDLDFPIVGINHNLRNVRFNKGDGNFNFENRYGRMSNSFNELAF